MLFASFVTYGVRKAVAGIGCRQKVLRGGLVTIWDNKVIREEEVVKSQRILAIKVRSLGDDFPWAI